MKLPFLKERELRLSLYHILGVYPHNLSIYKQALRHKSRQRLEGEKQYLGNNERLEFLGDAVLDATVGHIVYRHFRKQSEGFLTNTRSKLVQREMLNRLAHEVGLDRLIVYGSQNTAHNSYMGGNAFEALVGALYLDRGYDACMRFMEHRILGRFISLDNIAAKEVNFKSKLIEWAQKRKVELSFQCVEEMRENRSTPVFLFKTVIEGMDGETGRGYSKKESQQQASQSTLKRLQRDKEWVQQIMQLRDDRLSAAVLP
ncbi:MAG: ribonuclease III [Bacteroidaceae bacterium]|nr:ribonuclease III [Bacteroidaceae bacterium]